MSKEARKWAEQQRVADPTLMAVVQAIAWYADKGTGECRSSQGALALKAGLKERAVRYALVILERLEIVSRTPRSKGKYGRTTDLTVLALERNFDVSRGAIAAVRKSLRPPLQPAPRAAGTETSNRHLVPLQPAPRAGEYNQGDQELPYQVRVSTYVEGSSTEGEGTPVDRADYPANVIPLMPRGAA
jgi:hypothetical protein